MMLTNSKTFEDLISTKRLESYRTYFKVSTEEAIGLYLWNCELSACFSVLFSFFEVVLRNKIHRAMSQHYNQSDSAHWYDSDKITLSDKSLEKLKRVRDKIPSNSTPDAIISRLDFGFWAKILPGIDKGYAIYPAIFPKHNLNYDVAQWSDDDIKNFALDFIVEFNTFRNRMAHHEPLWKFSSTQGKRPQNKSKNISHSLSRFTNIIKDFDIAMNAMDDSFNANLKQASWRKKLEYLLSTEGFNQYKNLKTQDLASLDGLSSSPLCIYISTALNTTAP